MRSPSAAGHQLPVLLAEGKKTTLQAQRNNQGKVPFVMHGPMCSQVVTFLMLVKMAKKVAPRIPMPTTFSGNYRERPKESSD